MIIFVCIIFHMYVYFKSIIKMLVIKQLYLIFNMIYRFSLFLKLFHNKFNSTGIIPGFLF